MTVRADMDYATALDEVSRDGRVRRRSWPEGEHWQRHWVTEPAPATLPAADGETITLAEPTPADIAAIDYESVQTVTAPPDPEPCPPPPTGNSTAPAWVEDAITAGWRVGEWLAISGAAPTAGYGLAATNTLHSVNTAGDSVSVLQEALFESWVGAALCHGHRAHGTMLLGPAGSHNNYGKGTTYLFDLGTRGWEEVAGADTSGLKSSTEPVNHYGEYNSGRPVTNHCAWWPLWDSHRNELVYPRGWGSPTSGSDQFPSPYGHGLDLAGYDAAGYTDALWRRLPELAGLTASQLTGLSQQCGAVWDESRKAAWLLAGHNSFSGSGVCAQYDSVADAWTLHAPQWHVFLGSSYVIDPVRDVLLCGTVTGGGSVAVMNLAQPDVRYVGTALWTAQVTGAAPGSYVRCGFEWSDSLDGVLLYRHTTTATEVWLGEYAGGGSLVSGQQTDYTLEWRSLLAGTNAVTPPLGNGAGPYSRFRLARWGSREIAIFVGSVDGAVYAFRVT